MPGPGIEPRTRKVRNTCTSMGFSLIPHLWPHIAGKVEEKEFTYIGFRVTQHSGKIILDHSEYMKHLQFPVLDPKRAITKDDQLSCEELTIYRQLIGKLIWAVQGSRPDLAFEMIAASTKLKKGVVAGLTRANKQVNRLTDWKSYITFPGINYQTSTWKIVLFTDASLGNINNGTGSTGAHILWLADDSGRCCPIAWQASKIRRVVRSNIAAEALSLQEGLESSLYYRRMIEEVAGMPYKSIPINRI